MNKFHLSASQRIRDAVVSPAFVFAAFAVFAFIMYSRVPLMPGDDMTFRDISQHTAFFDFLWTRYTTWSGRVLSDAFSYLFAGQFYMVWYFFITAITVAGSFAVYKWVTFSKEFLRPRKFLMALLCCFGFGILSSVVLSPSAFWISGSLNYIVPYELGVIAFTPFVFAIKNPQYKTKKWLMAVSVICAASSVLCQEQSAVCLAAASVVTLAYLVIRNKKPYPFLIALTGVIMLAIAAYLLAPGNTDRYAGNTGYFPLFYQLGLMSRVSVTAHVSLNGLINQSTLPLLFLWLATGWMVIKKADKKPIRALGVVSIGFACVIALQFVGPDYYANVLSPQTHVWQLFQLPFPYLEVAWRYVFWISGLLLIPLNLFFIWGRSRKSFFYILVFIAAIASLVAVTLTPLAYFSGARTFFLTNMLFMLLLLFQFENFKELVWLAVAVVCIAFFRLVWLRLSWENGFALLYGVMDVRSIPFNVIP